MLQIVYILYLQDEGYTALILAGYMGYVEILKMLLDYGAEVNAQTTVSFAKINTSNINAT